MRLNDSLRASCRFWGTLAWKTWAISCGFVCGFVHVWGFVFLFVCFVSFCSDLGIFPQQSRHEEEVREQETQPGSFLLPAGGQGHATKGRLSYQGKKARSWQQQSSPTGMWTSLSQCECCNLVCQGISRGWGFIILDHGSSRSNCITWQQQRCPCEPDMAQGRARGCVLQHQDKHK